MNLMLDSHAILPFTTRLQPQWTAADVRRLTDGARTEMLDESLKLYMPLYVSCTAFLASHKPADSLQIHRMGS